MANQATVQRLARFAKMRDQMHELENGSSEQLRKGMRPLVDAVDKVVNDLQRAVDAGVDLKINLNTRV